jgi:hypothetical protein
MKRHIPAASMKENHMNQDQTPVRANTPENDKAKHIQGVHGADQSPPAAGEQPKPQPAKEAPPATPPKV